MSFTLRLLKVSASSWYREIDMTDEGGSIEFTSATIIGAAAIVTLIQSDHIAMACPAPACWSRITSLTARRVRGKSPSHG